MASFTSWIVTSSICINIFINEPTHNVKRDFAVVGGEWRARDGGRVESEGRGVESEGWAEWRARDGREWRRQ